MRNVREPLQYFAWNQVRGQVRDQVGGAGGLRLWVWEYVWGYVGDPARTQVANRVRDQVIADV